MAIAGKVAITPKEKWNSNTRYEKLDAVTHNNSMYIAKKDSKGVEPADGDTWMFAVTSLDQEQFDKLKAELQSNGYGEIAGGKNLLNPNYFASQIIKAGGTGNIDEVSWECSKINGYNEDLSGISFKKNTVYTIVLYGKCKNEANLATNLRIDYTDGTWSIPVFKTKNTNSLALYVTDSDKSISKIRFAYGSVGTDLQPKKCGIFKGVITESDFEPYFPSNKMLSDKTTQIDDNNMLGWVVPEEMPIKNYIDDNGVFHQRVGRVDLDELTMTYSNGSFRTSDLIGKTVKATSNETAPDLYLKGYKSIGANHVGANVNTMSISTATQQVVINTGSSTEKPSGWLYYKLAEEITTSVDGNEAVTKIQSNIASVKSQLADGHIYSTEEKIVGIWIDGKFVYERTVSGTLNFDRYATLGYAYDTIIDGNVDTLISGNGQVDLTLVIGESEGRRKYLIGSSEKYCTTAILVEGDDAIIQVKHDEIDGTVSGTYTVVIRYTKTADSTTEVENPVLS